MPTSRWRRLYHLDGQPQRLCQSRPGQAAARRRGGKPIRTSALELYAQANKIIWDDAVGVFPFDLQTNYVMNKKIQGFVPTPSTIPNFATVTIAE